MSIANSTGLVWHLSNYKIKKQYNNIIIITYVSFKFIKFSSKTFKNIYL